MVGLALVRSQGTGKIIVAEPRDAGVRGALIGNKQSIRWHGGQPVPDFSGWGRAPSRRLGGAQFNAKFVPQLHGDHSLTRSRPISYARRSSQQGFAGLREAVIGAAFMRPQPAFRHREIDAGAPFSRRGAEVR